MKGTWFIVGKMMRRAISQMVNRVVPWVKRSSPPPWKRILLPTATFLVVVLSVEVISAIMFSILTNAWFSYSRVREMMEAIAAGEQDTHLLFNQDEDDGNTRSLIEQGEILHPYLGYVGSSGSGEEMYGFVTSREPVLQQSSDDKVIIGIFGGSVAAQLAAYGSGSLKKVLERDPLFAGKEISFITIALGAYRQPQQLLALTYLLTLGGHFDMIVNVDGFNDIAMPADENFSRKIFPFYPWRWSIRMINYAGPQVRYLTGYTYYLKLRRQQLAETFLHLRYSATAAFLWAIQDHFMRVKVSFSEVSLEEAQKSDESERWTSEQVTGPRFSFDDRDLLYPVLANHWKESSRQMRRLAEANDMSYFHFLQPNQYLPGSKPFNTEEKVQGFDENHRFRSPIEKGYPVFIRAGQELQKEGESFHDLTQLFAKHEETIYVDTCCHFTHRGYALMGEAIAEAMLKDLRKR
ncbi:MAG: hypothetical protein Q7R81_07380 [Candidatus Peregrinibacteria bacterium]|nr:hypothetical protein [Candidatus Peregrinibacteria bacterium]